MVGLQDVQVAEVVVVVRRLSNRSNYGLVDMVEIRKALSHMTRNDQDEAINNARRELLVTGSCREGRTRPTAAEIAANLDDGIGYLSLRQ